MDAIRRENPDVVGLSGLITPSLEEMAYVASEMERGRLQDTADCWRGDDFPLCTLLLKIAPHYSGPTIHVRGRLEGPLASCRRCLASSKVDFKASISRQYAEIRGIHESTVKRRELLVLDEARRRKLQIDWASYTPPIPRSAGVRTFVGHPISDITELIDWEMFFAAWSMKKRLPKGTKRRHRRSCGSGASARRQGADPFACCRRKAYGERSGGSFPGEQRRRRHSRLR